MSLVCCSSPFALGFDDDYVLAFWGLGGMLWTHRRHTAALQKFDLPPVRVGHAWRMLHVQLIISMDAFNKCRWFAWLLVCDATFKNVP